MLDRTIYSITEKVKAELKAFIKEAVLQFGYDTNIFTIAALIMDVLETQ